MSLTWEREMSPSSSTMFCITVTLQEKLSPKAATVEIYLKCQNRAVQGSSHLSHVAVEHLKCAESDLTCAV